MKKILVLALIIIGIYIFKPVQAPSASVMNSFNARETSAGGKFNFHPVTIDFDFSLLSIGIAKAHDDDKNVVWLFGAGLTRYTQAIKCKKQRICDLNGASWYVYIQARPLQVSNDENVQTTLKTGYHVD